MRKKILFVINTLSRAGAEMALLEWLRKLDKEDTYELSLFVLMGQGEMIDQLPPGVHVVNERYIRTSVLEENKADVSNHPSCGSRAWKCVAVICIYDSCIRSYDQNKTDTAGQTLVAHDSGWRRTTERNL